MKSETNERKRREVGPMGKIALISMLATVVVLIGGGLIITGSIDPFSMVPGVILLLLVAAMATRWRWVPALAALLNGLLLLMVVTFISPALARPQDPDFAFAVLITAFPLLTVIAAIVATVQNYRSGEPRVPGWFRAILTVGSGLVIGVVALSLLVEKPTEVRVSAEMLDDLTSLGTRDFRFTRTQIRVNVGEMVALRLDNRDSTGHSFDVDALDVHVPMYRDQTSLALFRPMEAGTYRFYCGIPGHADLENGTGMVGTLIVESS